MKPKYKFVTLINLTNEQVEEKLNEGWILNCVNAIPYKKYHILNRDGSNVIKREYYFIKPEFEDVNPNYYRKSDFNTEL
jgi:hypothetical protein